LKKLKYNPKGRNLMRKREAKNKQTGPRETIEEYLARGGKVTYIPAVQSEEDQSNKVASSSGASATMMTLSEGALYFSESRAKPKERKKSLEKTINTAALPAALLKYMLKHQDEEE
jgi:hypothetical protein